MDDELLNILSKRSVPDTPEGLCDRILSASQRVPKPERDTKSAGSWLWGFTEQFLLPRPVFALVLVLIFGVAVGLNSSLLNLDVDMSMDMSIEDLSAFMLAGDEFETGDFS